MYYLTKYSSLEKKLNEYVVDFNKRFNKLDNNIPREIKKFQRVAKVTYVGEFDADFSMALRKRRALVLTIM